MIKQISEKFLQILNRYTAMEKMPMDFGTGEKLRPSEIHTIEAIGKNHEINITGLAAKMGITKGGISQMINKLDKKRLVNKSRDPLNDKEVRLRLTAKGWSAFAGHEKLHASLYNDMIKYLTPVPIEQVVLLQEVLNKLAFHMDDYTKRTG